MDDVIQEKGTISKTDITTGGKSLREKLGEKIALGDKLVLHSTSVLNSGISNFGIIAAEEKEIDASLKTYGFTESDWQLILVFSYSLAEKSEGEKNEEPWNVPEKIGKKICEYSDRAIRLTLLLRELKNVRKQYNIDGIRNIWIVKAPDTSRGVGLQLLYRLQDILECQKGMGCRTVQKYIEIPLLAPKLPKIAQFLPNNTLNDVPNNIPNSLTNASIKNNTYDKTISYEDLGSVDSRLDDRNAQVKFDIRVWVLVTSYELSNLCAYVYTTVYGRRCSVPYNLDIKMLGDNFIHLTNYSVQKKGIVLEMGSGCGPWTGSGIEKGPETGTGFGIGTGTGTQGKVPYFSENMLEGEGDQRCSSFGSHSSRTRCESEDAGEGSLAVRSCSYSNPLEAVRSLRLRSNSARTEVSESEKDESEEKGDRDDGESSLLGKDRIGRHRSNTNKSNFQHSRTEKRNLNGFEKFSRGPLLRSRSGVGTELGKRVGKGVGRGGTGRAGNPLSLHIHAHTHRRHRVHPGKLSDKTHAVSTTSTAGVELLIGAYESHDFHLIQFHNSEFYYI